MQELRRCPFCGNSATLKSFNVFGAKWEKCFYVRCEKCRAEINNPVPYEKEAAEAWNRRASDGET